AAMAARESVTRDFRGDCLTICVCIYILCCYMEEHVMTSAANFAYGLASPDRIAAMTGKQILRAIIEGELPQAPISQALTFWIVEVGDGLAAFEGEPGPHLLNPMGSVHGGWALTLIDSVAACAGYSLLPAGVGFTTVETKGNFSRPITKTTG